MTQKNPAITAFFWMMGTVMSFAGMAVSGREIAAELDTFELMLFRSIIGLIIISAIIWRSESGFYQVRTNIISRHFLRNLIHYTGQNLWFYALAIIPLSQIIAIEFTSPIWVALLAPIFLGEQLTRTKLLVAGMGFLGVIIVAQPGTAPLQWAHLAAVGAAVGFALANMSTRSLTQRNTVLCLLFWMTAMQTVFSIPLAMIGGITLPTLQILPWVFVAGTVGLSAHFCLSTALRLAPASIVAPMDFIRLPMMVFIGFVAYDEKLVMSAFIGGAIILAANLLNLRER